MFKKRNSTKRGIATNFSSKTDRFIAVDPNNKCSKPLLYRPNNQAYGPATKLMFKSKCCNDSLVYYNLSSLPTSRSNMYVLLINLSANEKFKVEEQKPASSTTSTPWHIIIQQTITAKGSSSSTPPAQPQRWHRCNSISCLAQRVTKGASCPRWTSSSPATDFRFSSLGLGPHLHPVSNQHPLRLLSSQRSSNIRFSSRPTQPPRVEPSSSHKPCLRATCSSKCTRFKARQRNLPQPQHRLRILPPRSSKVRRKQRRTRQEYSNLLRCHRQLSPQPPIQILRAQPTLLTCSNRSNYSTSRPLLSSSRRARTRRPTPRSSSCSTNSAPPLNILIHKLYRQQHLQQMQPRPPQPQRLAVVSLGSSRRTITSKCSPTSNPPSTSSRSCQASRASNNTSINTSKLNSWEQARVSSCQAPRR